MEELEEKGYRENIHAVGHRVVHGGEKFKKPALIDESVINAIEENIAIAPLHNPANLKGIFACQKILSGISQVAVFDTAFHHTLPEVAWRYAIPEEYYKKYKIRKYGFHGTSHKFVAEKVGRVLGKSLSSLKVITCHLGNGCSVAAVKYGESVDTSMGFTPLEGLVMGTRGYRSWSGFAYYAKTRIKY